MVLDKPIFRKLFVKYSLHWTILFSLLAAAGAYVSKDIELKLSLTDLLPQDHPSVKKFNRLTEIVGGVGYIEVLLHAEDKKSHLAIAPIIEKKFKENPHIRSAFYLREEHFFLTRALYYAEIDKLKDLEKNVDEGLVKAKRKIFDIGLWDEDGEKPKEETKKVELDPELRKVANRAAKINPYLLSDDGKDLLLMVKPNFDSLDMGKSRELVNFTDKMLKETVKAPVEFRVTGRYYNKVKDADVIEHDIFVLGLLSNVVMALILLLYFQSLPAVISIFIPVVLGLGITTLVTWLFIGHINIITGFLVGILAGVGSDYGIHLLWRIRLEQKNPSSSDPDPLWRTIITCGWANFVTLFSTGMCLFSMCASSFKVFSEFGFICGVGLSAILISKMGTFYFTSKLLKLESLSEKKYPFSNRELPILSSARRFNLAVIVVGFLVIMASQVGFEFDFDRMMEHSPEVKKNDEMIKQIYNRSTSPSAFAAPSREEALALEDFLKKKYMPDVIGNMVTGVSIVPENQTEKEKIILRIQKKIKNIRNKAIEEATDIPAASIRTWVNSKPFTWGDLPIYVQEALRGTEQAGYLFYVYPATILNTGPAVSQFAAMIKDVEKNFPNIVSGSDAGIFSDILVLIERDGILLLIAIFTLVGAFIWLNLRDWRQTVLCYVPFLVSLPVAIGLMALFRIKFNIFNVALVPIFIGVGIEIPIQLMQRAVEIRSGFRSVRDIAVSLQLSLLTTAIGFGILVFTRAGVLKSLGWMSIMATGAIWIVGCFIHPAILERYFRKLDGKKPA